MLIFFYILLSAILSSNGWWIIISTGYHGQYGLFLLTHTNTHIFILTHLWTTWTSHILSSNSIERFCWSFPFKSSFEWQWSVLGNSEFKAIHLFINVFPSNETKMSHSRTERYVLFRKYLQKRVRNEKLVTVTLAMYMPQHTFGIPFKRNHFYSMENENVISHAGRNSNPKTTHGAHKYTLRGSSGTINIDFIRHMNKRKKTQQNHSNWWRVNRRTYFARRCARDWSECAALEIIFYN